MFVCSLVEEVHELSQSVEALMKRLSEAEETLRNLQDQRMTIEKDISNKKNTLFIDREKAMPHRTRYPPMSRLQGYQWLSHLSRVDSGLTCRTTPGCIVLLASVYGCGWMLFRIAVPYAWNVRIRLGENSGILACFIMWTNLKK